MELQQEIMEAIIKALPAMQVGIIQNRLNQLDALEENAESAATTNANLKDEIASLDNTVEHHRALLQKHTDIDDRTNEINTRDGELALRDKELYVRELHMELLEERVTAAESRRADAFDMATLMMGRKKYTYERSENTNEPGPTDNYGSATVNTTTKSITESGEK